MDAMELLENIKVMRSKLDVFTDPQQREIIECLLNLLQFVQEQITELQDEVGM
jgi:hypothetical protein